MSWKFELLMKPEGELITEGPVWTGEEILFTHIRRSRILRYDPKTKAITVWRGIPIAPRRPVLRRAGKALRLLLRRARDRALGALERPR